MRPNALLYLTILIEGYVVLAVELLAIRLLIPFVGSGTEVIAITISCVLLPLAVGYHAGGQRLRRARRKRAATVRALLLSNVLSATGVLALGLSYPFLEVFFAALEEMGIRGHLAQTACYGLIFLVLPVYWLAQTVPLVSNYFSRERLSEITGRMLFFSTVGSFLGSVFSTLVLMMTIGVHHTVLVTLGMLGLLALALARRLVSRTAALAVALWAGAFALNNAALMDSLHVVSNNAYNLAQVIEIPRNDARLLMLNRSKSSVYSPRRDKRFAYIEYLDKVFIDPALKGEKKRILVIGAGGFVVGWEDRKNDYTFVDIDPDLQRIAETHVLPEKLPPNKRFVAQSARAFLARDREAYDLVIVDVYTNVESIPMECVTAEFWQSVKARLAPGGIVVVNALAKPNFSDLFSVRYDNTFASVFPAYTRQMVAEYDAWDTAMQVHNVIYAYYHHPQADDVAIYTDDKNTYSLDRE